jgi:hypothetical protein
MISSSARQYLCQILLHSQDVDLRFMNDQDIIVACEQTVTSKPLSLFEHYWSLWLDFMFHYLSFVNGCDLVYGLWQYFVFYHMQSFIFMMSGNIESDFLQLWVHDWVFISVGAHIWCYDLWRYWYDFIRQRIRSMRMFTTRSRCQILMFLLENQLKPL